jgi:hypothetical protein
LVREILLDLNQSLSAAIVIISFSLFLYLFTQNLRSHVARAFSTLLALVCFTYAGDVALFQVHSIESGITWLKFQWIGIAFMPAAFLYFSDELLRTSNDYSKKRRLAVVLAYLMGVTFLALAIGTELLVYDGFYYPGITQFKAGPLFGLFALYFFVALAWGVYNIYRARKRCLTSTSRRRMTYLGISSIAPAAGVFPYLLVASFPAERLPAEINLTILFLGNTLILGMIVIMAYSVAYFGVLTPDRVVKHNLVYFLLRGPFVAALVIALILSLPGHSSILGLPREMILITGVVLVIVTSELVISVAKPFLDFLLFRRDIEEIVWIRELDRRLLTSTDLEQALENVLTALCEVLRVRNGFIANTAAQASARVEAYIGSMEMINEALENIDVTQLVEQQGVGYRFIAQEQFWYMPLRAKSKDQILGIIGVEARQAEPDLSEDEANIISVYARQAENALEDQCLQQEVFNALRLIIPGIDQVQRLRGLVRYTGSPGLDAMAGSPVNSPDFSQWVRDALTDYWGGPKLTKSPLLSLGVVKEALDENDGNAVRALRAVLSQAIDDLRPTGERHLTAAEWVLYNILEMKFIQGMKVHDIAQKLAMSESDLYRKQRVAIQEVARALAEMEQKNSDLTAFID